MTTEQAEIKGATTTEDKKSTTMDLSEFDPAELQRLLPAWQGKMLEGRYLFTGKGLYTFEVSKPPSQEETGTIRLTVSGKNSRTGELRPFLNVTSFAYQRQEDGSYVTRFQNRDGKALRVFNSGNIAY
ncbi:MAG: hypothetical protein NUV69_01515 [Candidatus Curtissbacteria bacterium]|nr:hypothetical protein [Candidatus Curtissbacteria bacterium]